MIKQIFTATILAFTFLLASSMLVLPASNADTSPPDVTQLSDWSAASDSVLEIETANHQRYEVVLENSCSGLMTSESIAFLTHGIGRLDQHAAIELPGEGTRCDVASVVPRGSDPRPSLAKSS